MRMNGKDKKPHQIPGTKKANEMNGSLILSKVWTFIS